MSALVTRTIATSDTGWVQVSTFPAQKPAFWCGGGGMADTSMDDLAEQQLLLCDEIITETPLSDANSHNTRWTCLLDGTWISSDGESPCASEWSPISPNVDELLSYEEERIDGTLNERINSMIERSERLRAKPFFSIAGEHAQEACTPKAEFSGDVTRLGVSERRSLVLEILEVCDRYELLPNTAALAVNYLDRFFSLGLTSPDIKRAQIHADDLLKSVSFACLSIAIKLEEVVSITPDELQDHVPPGKRIHPATINLVEDLVLKRLDWRLNAITAVSFLSPFILMLQGMPQWANTMRDLQDFPAGWAEEHQHLWVQSVKHVTRSLAEAGLQRYTEAEKALAALMCALADNWFDLSGRRAEEPLQRLFAYLALTLHQLDTVQVYACWATMQRVGAASVAPIKVAQYPLLTPQLQPHSPVSILDGLATTPRAYASPLAVLGKRKAND
uniref:Cyclin N-terminal domain-containing protein n=1 Tax=Pyramimonas obovata TaxID=1411642 RepID=A0A7S0N2F7_9CHLO